MSCLVGKLFIGVVDNCMRSGVIEAVIHDGLYLVRFDQFIGFSDGSKWPDSMAVVSVATMIGSHDVDAPPHWELFDTEEQRATYEAWQNQMGPEPQRTALAIH